MIGMIIAIIWIHFVADFILQSNHIATNKSKYIMCLVEHCCIYALPFFILGIKYALMNSLLHFVIDFSTSRIATYYYGRNRRRAFFITIGCDQAIHMTCLILTMHYIKLWW